MNNMIILQTELNLERVASEKPMLAEFLRKRSKGVQRILMKVPLLSSYLFFESFSLSSPPIFFLSLSLSLISLLPTTSPLLSLFPTTSPLLSLFPTTSPLLSLLPTSSPLLSLFPTLLSSLSCSSLSFAPLCFSSLYCLPWLCPPFPVCTFLLYRTHPSFRRQRGYWRMKTEIMHAELEQLEYLQN